MQGYDYYRTAFEGEEFPLAFVDREALESNIERVRERADGTPVRIASKSIRCPWVMERVLERDGFQGIMAYSGHEAAFLAERGFEDLLVAYPVWHREEVRAACEAIEAGARVLLMVDAPPHVERVAEVAREAGVEVPLCIDVDMSTTHLGIHFGVRRSGIQTPEEALGVARSIADTEGVTLDGIMGYEAQIAGLADRSPGNNAAVNAAIRWMKGRSKAEIQSRRGDVLAALEDRGFAPDLVNGGGTGSVEYTTDDPAVTEVTVGSGFYAPRLFDYHDGFQHEPAAGYAIEVTRRPAPDIYTCRGGGFVASGPPGPDKAPAPELPEGAALLDNEGAGEVQTPVHYDGSVELSLGDPVVMRHAKAGELCRSFTELAVVSGGEIVERAPTYRGDGQCFL